jgi:Flp pilus assembly pilin Flp
VTRGVSAPIVRRCGQNSAARLVQPQPDCGASSVEYAILVGFIAAVAAAAFFSLGSLVLEFFSQGKGAFE